MRWRQWVIAASAFAAVALAGDLLNGNIRYEVGVGRVSGHSIAATFTHRPLAFRLLSAGQAWLPEQVSNLAGPPTSWPAIATFEAGFRLIAMLASAVAAFLLARGLARRWGSAAWPAGVAAYAALAFTAPATGEPDWMAALLAVAAVGAGLSWRPRVGGSVAGVLLAGCALVKVSSLFVALAALVVVWAFDRRRGGIAAAVALVTGLAAAGATWRFAPWEIGWLLDIRAIQPDPWTRDNVALAGVYLGNVVARWPTVALVPVFFVWARAAEAWTAAAAVALTAFGVVFQGQYYLYHAIPFVTLSAVLAVRAVQRVRAALRWPLVALTAWTAALFVTPADWRLANASVLFAVTGGWVVLLLVWQWWGLCRPPELTRSRTDAWASVLAVFAMLATQTPLSAESLTLGTAGRTAAFSMQELRADIADAEQVHRLIGGPGVPVAYLVFGADTYTLGNPTNCRYPSALFLQRPEALGRVSTANRDENLACLTEPAARWLIWDRTWLHRKGAPSDLLTTIDETWACEQATVIDRYTVCPRRT